jgi:hypothetical protein
MNLVKFRKDLDYDEYWALPLKDESTLYFCRNSNRLYLGSTRYGKTFYEVDETESIAFALDENDFLTAVVKISQVPGNALELKADGLYTPPASIPPIDKPDDGDLVIATIDSIDDSRIAIIEELTAECNNWMAPSLAAVLNAISKVAPIWNAETIDDGIFPQNEVPEDPTIAEKEIHDWLDCMDLVVEEDQAPISRESSFLCSNGETVAFAFTLRINDLFTYSQYKAVIPDAATLLQMPAELAPRAEQRLPFSVWKVLPDGSTASLFCGCLLIAITGAAIFFYAYSFSVYTTIDFDIF